jgi:hypothetical protein
VKAPIVSEVCLLTPQFSAIGSIINRMAYGDEIFKEHGQKILEMNHEGMDLMITAGNSFWLVDVFALCMHSLPSIVLCISLRFSVRYIPSWFPGATFQQLAERSKVVSHYLRYEPWRLVLDRVRFIVIFDDLNH